MPDDVDAFLQKMEAPSLLASLESLIEQSYIAHLSQCQQLENGAWEAFADLPFLRDPAIEYIRIMRERYQSVHDYYHQAFLPALRNFATGATEIDQALGQRSAVRREQS